MAEYRKLPPIGPRVLSPEQQAALDALDKPNNRGKRISKKEPTEGGNSKSSKSTKRKTGEGDSSHQKKKKIKKMARSSKSPTPPRSEHDDENEEEVPSPPPSPKQTIPLSDPIITPLVSSQQTTLPPPPPIIPISTTHLSSPILPESTTTTNPNPTVNVNVSDTGATTVTETPVVTKPFYPIHSTNSGATFGGENDEYDSTYFSPYRLPTDDDIDTPFTTQHLQEIHEKPDCLLDDSKAYSGVVLKAFLETAIDQYTKAIEKSTQAVDASTSSCKQATT
ncbi:uncharacterized protein LOC111882443 [Lactuca sativa]|uniref:uncharacterized protein LOC111882443 n=1 Tax=Lactuca sativa TaxID=4236 RepID=UPI000CD95F03|nr:uncharacterized protein LOC111882443 [Lactuca sativa]